MKKALFIFLLISFNMLVAQGNGNRNGNGNGNGNGNTNFPWKELDGNIYFDTGNVGVGTTTPSQKLEVSGNTLVTGNLFTIGNMGIGTNDPVRELHIKKDVGTIYQLIQTGSNFLGIGVNNAFQFGPTFAFHNNSQLRFGKASAITATGATGFQELMRLDNNGNLGIGATNPVTKLHINQSSGTVYQLLQTGSNFLGIGVNSASQFGPSLVFNNNSQFRIGKASGITATGATGFQELLRVDNNGNVGIGTNTPSEKLDVIGNAKINGTIITNRIEIEAPDNSDNNWIALNIGRETSPFFRNFNFSVSPTTSTNERLGFDIEDKNNIQRQEIYFRDDFSRVLYRNNRNEVYLNFDSNDREGENRASLQLPISNSVFVVGAFSDYLKDQNHKLIVKDGTALIENAIYTNGRIAIGTIEPDPGYALTVKGKVHVQEVKVDLLGTIAPDYVFKDDYKLKTLEDVNTFINEEGHLPNIPSATEMEQNGINLKEMNMKLLEKVEELTLYTIAQEKAIQAQQEVNSQLVERLEKLEQLLKK